MQPRRVVWIVEMWCDQYRRIKPRWEATVGASTTRDHGLFELARWRGRNPDDRFRLVKYLPLPLRGGQR